MSVSLEQILNRFKERGFRVTDATRRVVELLFSAVTPLTVPEMQKDPNLADRDPVTIYRVVERLESAGLIRRVRLHSNTQAFQLAKADNEKRDVFLICRECGKGEVLSEPFDTRQVSEELSLQFGWFVVDCEVEFFGICSDCAERIRKKTSG